MSKYKVTAYSLYVREEPRLTAIIAGVLHKDEIIEVIDTSGDGYWHRIQRDDGLRGWASHKYLVSLENEDEIIDEEFPWMPIAIREIGVYEYDGAADNPRIIEYLRSTTLGDSHHLTDQIFWCSAFVNWCVEKSGYSGTDSAWARSWHYWGEAIEQPRRGCIAVFTRGEGGHVGFYVGETETTVKVLGGNQNDSVSIKNYLKSRLLSFRVPLE